MNTFPRPFRHDPKKHAMNILRTLPALALATLLSACNTPLTRPDAPATYQLAPEITVQAVRETPLALTLQVARPIAAAGLDTEMMAYRRSAYRLDYYAQSRWAAPPADMLTDQLARAIEDAGIYRVVLGPEARLPADIRLYTELTALEHVIKGGSVSQGSEVRMAVRMKLVDVLSAKVLASGTVEVIRPAFSQDAQGAVNAANEAAREVIERAIAFCAENSPRTENNVAAPASAD